MVRVGVDVVFDICGNEVMLLWVVVVCEQVGHALSSSSMVALALVSVLYVVVVVFLFVGVVVMLLVVVSVSMIVVLLVVVVFALLLVVVVGLVMSIRHSWLSILIALGLKV